MVSINTHPPDRRTPNSCTEEAEHLPRPEARRGVEWRTQHRNIVVRLRVRSEAPHRRGGRERRDTSEGSTRPLRVALVWPESSEDLREVECAVGFGVHDPHGVFRVAECVGGLTHDDGSSSETRVEHHRWQQVRVWQAHRRLELVMLDDDVLYYCIDEQEACEGGDNRHWSYRSA